MYRYVVKTKNFKVQQPKIAEIPPNAIIVNFTKMFQPNAFNIPLEGHIMDFIEIIINSRAFLLGDRLSIDKDYHKIDKGRIDFAIFWLSGHYNLYIISPKIIKKIDFEKAELLAKAEYFIKTDLIEYSIGNILIWDVDYYNFFKHKLLKSQNWIVLMYNTIEDLEQGEKNKLIILPEKKKEEFKKLIIQKDILVRERKIKTININDFK